MTSGEPSTAVTRTAWETRWRAQSPVPQAISSAWPPRAGRSVAVQLDRVAVRVLDIDSAALAAAVDADARLSDPRADLLPLGTREAQTEGVEAPGSRIDPAAGLDEVQQIVAARRLPEDHALVGKRAR